ncbi:MAG: ECF-type sigma factor [Gemmatimonadota bacterium]|nr:ECF-type sigma factor [Gemmatimonadota bacterium]
MSFDREDPGAVTTLVARWQGGDASAEEALFSAIYDELRTVATQLMQAERSSHTLQPTALVHEAYLRLNAAELEVMDRVHLLALAARVMRRFLVDHARARGRGKRGGGARHITLDAEHASASAEPLDLAAFDAVLTRLEALDTRMAEFVQLRYFAGLTNDEIAQVAGVSTRTVKRQLHMARAWIKKELEAE